MNTLINNEAILLNEEILWAEKSLRNTQAMLDSLLGKVDRFGMPMNPSSCSWTNRQIGILRQSIKKEKAELAELPSFTNL
jgi:hypothetical protein